MQNNQAEYLYDRMGPWPQPNPVLPNDEFPTVVHVPTDEWWYYEQKIGIRYYTQMFYYIPAALWYAFNHKGLIPVSNQEFVDFLCVRSYAKFLTAVDRNDIPGLLPGMDMNLVKADKQYFVSDLYLMHSIPSQPDGQCSAPSAALFESPGGDVFTPIAIWSGYNEKGVVIYPENGDAWELAKYYCLMGACYRLVLSVHSIMHFPMDTVNAITKTALPKNNLVLKLLYPHFDFSLELNRGVLCSYSSPIKNHPQFPYTGMTGTDMQIAGLFADAHIGVASRPKSYPPFHFTLEPLMDNNTMYARFEKEYYHCILRFVKKIIQHLPDDDKPAIREWADYIYPWLNKHVKAHHHYVSDPMRHFPSGAEIFNRLPDGDLVIEKLLAKIIWDLSVGHASDHYDYAAMNFQQVPFRMRIPAPDGKMIHHFDPKNARTWVDTFKHRMEWKMFFTPTNVTLLQDTNYNFDDPHLKKYHQEFLADLRATEAGLKDKGIRNFAPLNQLSGSIQY